MVKVISVFLVTVLSNLAWSSQTTIVDVELGRLFTDVEKRSSEATSKHKILDRKETISITKTNDEGYSRNDKVIGVKGIVLSESGAAVVWTKTDTSVHLKQSSSLPIANQIDESSKIGISFGNKMVQPGQTIRLSNHHIVETYSHTKDLNSKHMPMERD